MEPALSTLSAKPPALSAGLLSENSCQGVRRTNPALLSGSEPGKFLQWHRDSRPLDQGTHQMSWSCEFGACGPWPMGLEPGGAAGAAGSINLSPWVFQIFAFARALHGSGSSGGGYSFAKQWWSDVKSCVSNYGLPTLESDLNPFTPGVMTPATTASEMSQASLAAAATWSVERGLTVPLRSSIVRAGLSNAEALGKLSGVLSMAGIDVALADAVYAEYKGCL